MPDIKIRRMTLDDVDAVYDIEKSCFTTPWERASFVSEMTTNRCARYMVLLDGGEIVAYAGMWVVINEGHVTNIAVKPGHRGNRFGTLVTEALIRLAANLGVTWMTLEVRVTNTIARKMYYSLGFTDAGIRKGYYEDTGEDALLMVREGLPPPDPDFDGDEAIVFENTIP